MATEQGDPALVNDPVAQALLRSPIPARLGYVSQDGSPRVTPIWFHWTGEEIVFGGPPDAPRVKAIRANPQVAVTIDANEWPYKVLMLRGRATVEIRDGVIAEYEAAAKRYFGEEQGTAWVAQIRQMGAQQSRIALRPDWVGIIDFETRFPCAIADKMW